MGFLSGVVIFVSLWWTIIFITLPFGHKRAENGVPGHAGSAPVRHHMARKAIITTLMTIVLWYPVHTGFVALLDQLRNDARQMADDDRASPKQP